MSDELRACPCGGYGTLYSGHEWFQLECHKCGYETGASNTRAEVVAEWNTRAYAAELAAKDQRIAELEAALKEVVRVNYGPQPFPSVLEGEDEPRWACLGCSREAFSREMILAMRHEEYCLGPYLWRLLGGTR